jgi:hypothetical protein
MFSFFTNWFYRKKNNPLPAPLPTVQSLPPANNNPEESLPPANNNPEESLPPANNPEESLPPANNNPEPNRRRPPPDDYETSQKKEAFDYYVAQQFREGNEEMGCPLIRSALTSEAVAGNMTPIGKYRRDKYTEKFLDLKCDEHVGGNRSRKKRRRRRRGGGIRRTKKRRLGTTRRRRK